MGILQIDNVDEIIVKKFTDATEEEKNEMKRIVSYWLNRDSKGLEQLLERRKQAEKIELKRKALHYADHHPVFPLNWAKNKITREEMNER